MSVRKSGAKVRSEVSSPGSREKTRAPGAASPPRPPVATRRPCCDEIDAFEAATKPEETDIGLVDLQVSTHPRGHTLVRLGGGDNIVDVSRQPDGSLKLTGKDREVVLTPEQSRSVVIDCGGGDDVVTLDESVGPGLRVHGGPGNDHIIGNALDNDLFGGEGNDLVEGSGTLAGGPGNDWLSGGDTNDRLYGGLGINTMNGGPGDDSITGGPERDFIHGGPGNDTLEDPGGVNQIFGGEGDDTVKTSGGIVSGGPGTDRIDVTGPTRVYQDGPDAVSGEGATLHDFPLTTMNKAGGLPGSTFQVKGTTLFVRRVQEDLEVLRSLPTGRALLVALDDSGHTLSIEASEAGNSANPAVREDAWLKPDGSPGKGTSGTVFYNPSRVWVGTGDQDWRQRPPPVGLGHELIHAWDYVSGTLHPGENTGGSDRELAAVGLPYDHDLDPNTPPQFPDSRQFTENLFREALSLVSRNEY